MARIGRTAVVGALLGYFMVVNVALPLGRSPGEARPMASINAPYQNADPIELASTTGASYNWAGYVAQGGEYTAVSATWTVPQSRYPTGAVAPIAADAAWVGIGGVKTRDLIQAGTQALVDSTGTARYQAWYEVLPDVSQPVDLDIEPGDSVSIAVTYSGDNRWHISFVNNTTRKSTSIDVAYESSFSSAEWIQEVPSLALEHGRGSMPLSDFGRITFINASAVEDGQAKSLRAAGAEALRMQNGLGDTLASPSIVSGTDSFSVVRRDAISVAPTRRVHIIIVGD